MRFGTTWFVLCLLFMALFIIESFSVTTAQKHVEEALDIATRYRNLCGERQ